MRLSGLAISLCVLLLEALLIVRGARRGVFRFLPLLFAYLIYDFCTTGFTYCLYWVQPKSYPTAYWLCFLLSILVEFAVLVEISDHIFQPFPAIRNLGRGLTLLVCGVFGVTYVLPNLLKPQVMRSALLNFALRTSLTKAAILVVLFLTVRHFGLKLGRNVAGLMLGFAVYQGVNVANLAAARTIAPALYAGVLWIIAPAAYILCLLVWTVAIWGQAPMPVAKPAGPSLEVAPEEVALGLARFNNTLSRFLHK